MSCAPEHARFNFLAVTAATAIVQQREGRPVDGTALAMGLAASALPSLPDLLGVDPVRWTVSGLILKPSEVSRQHAVGHARAH